MNKETLMELHKNLVADISQYHRDAEAGKSAGNTMAGYYQGVANGLERFAIWVSAEIARIDKEQNHD